MESWWYSVETLWNIKSAVSESDYYWWSRSIYGNANWISGKLRTTLQETFEAALQLLISLYVPSRRHRPQFLILLFFLFFDAEFSYFFHRHLSSTINCVVHINTNSMADHPNWEPSTSKITQHSVHQISPGKCSLLRLGSYFCNLGRLGRGKMDKGMWLSDVRSYHLLESG